MKKQTRRLLVNISAVLVVVNVVSALSIGVYLVSFYFPVVFDILGVYWIGSMVLALVLLIVSSVGKKPKINTIIQTPRIMLQRIISL